MNYYIYFLISIFIAIKKSSGGFKSKSFTIYRAKISGSLSGFDKSHSKVSLNPILLSEADGNSKVIGTMNSPSNTPG
jgi:hypothetical protein